MQKFMKRICAFFICAALCVNLTACSQRSINTNQSETAAFDTFLQDLFIASVTQDTITLHYTLKNPAAYGITDYDITFGGYPSDNFDQEIAGNLSDLKKEEQKLTKFDYASLTRTQQQTYDILQKYYEQQENLSQYAYYSTYFGNVSGIQSNLPVTLAEYQFYTEQDVKDYLSLLTLVPAYFQTACAFEQARVDKGLGLSDTALEEVVKQCSDFTSKTTDNMLITTFNERIENLGSLSGSQIKTYELQNQDLVCNTILGTYKDTIKQLTACKGKGKSNGGICSYPRGADYYSSLVQWKTGSDWSMDEMNAKLDNAAKEAFSQIYAVYTNNTDAYTYYYSDNFSYSVTDPSSILDSLKIMMQENFPAPAQVDYTIKYVENSLEDMLSPAFYMIPAVDDSSNNVIYINKGKTGDSLFPTLAHEGYPGHLYQTTYYNALHPHPIRSQITCSGYTEGWATYVELYSYNYASFDTTYDDDLSTLAQATGTMNLALSTRIDLGVNYYGWTVHDVEELLRQYGMNTDSSQTIYDYVIENPGNYLTYYIGCLEFQSLEAEARKALGDTFDEKSFYEAVLSTGSCPFSIVEAAVQDYIYSKQ